eukprot:2971769-Pleurochrysis_carterae.AAC.3
MRRRASARTTRPSARCPPRACRLGSRSRRGRPGTESEAAPAPDAAPSAHSRTRLRTPPDARQAPTYPRARVVPPQAARPSPPASRSTARKASGRHGSNST